MATTTTEADVLWAGIDEQRARTAQLLEGLEPAQWDFPSLCDGWTVRHVAAHLTLQEQRIRDFAAFFVRHPRMVRSLGLNATIHDSAIIQADVLTPEQIVQRIRAGIGSRRHNAFLTPMETLTDIIVHGQDMAIPLGLELPVRPSLAAVAATRRWDTRHSWLASVNRRLPLDDYRFRATDVAWARGEGPEVSGPIAAVLLLLTGRTAGLVQLSGDGAAMLRGHEDVSS